MALNGVAEEESIAPWGNLPRDVLQTVGMLLSHRDQQAGRLVCRAWRSGISYGVTYLRPRTIPHAGALAPLGVPAQLTAFPNIRTLDLRRTSISPFQIKQLLQLSPSVQTLQLTYLERIGRPHEYLEQIQELYAGLQQLASRMQVEVELFVNEAASARSFTLSDADLAKVVAAPKPLMLMSLHISRQLAYYISNASLATIQGLCSLRCLELETYSADITDSVFREFSALTALESLHIGLLKHVTGEGLAAGLSNSPQLTDLSLVDCSRLQNRGLAQLVAAVPQLRSLQIRKFPWVTDSAMKHLQGLSCLEKLLLADNGNVTYPGGLRRLQALHQLRHIELKRLSHIGPQEVESLFSLDNVEQVNDRCKLMRRPEAIGVGIAEQPSYALM